MADYIQIGDDPTKWWLVQPFNANQLTGQPLTLDLAGPLGGSLVLSGRADSVAVFNVPDATVPADSQSLRSGHLPADRAGASAHHFGYALSTTAMVDEPRQRDRDRDAQRDPPDHPPVRRRDAGDRRRDAVLRRHPAGCTAPSGSGHSGPRFVAPRITSRRVARGRPPSSARRPRVCGAAFDADYLLSYSSWRRKKLRGSSSVRASFRPRGVRSSHWYMPHRPSRPRA